MPAPGEGKTGPSLNTKYYQVNPNGQVGTKKTIDMAFTNQDATNAMKALQNILQSQVYK